MPYLELDSLWQDIEQAYRQERDPFKNPPHTAMAVAVAVFDCPADGRARAT